MIQAGRIYSLLWKPLFYEPTNIGFLKYQVSRMEFDASKCPQLFKKKPKNLQESWLVNLPLCNVPPPEIMV